MPVRVKCPNGCVFHVPESRAGKAVRCPECKAAIRLSSNIKKTASKKSTTAIQRKLTPELIAPDVFGASDLAPADTTDAEQAADSVFENLGSKTPGNSESLVQQNVPIESADRSIEPADHLSARNDNETSSFPKEGMPELQPQKKPQKKSKSKSNSNTKAKAKANRKKRRSGPDLVPTVSEEDERIAAQARAEIAALKEREKRILETPDFLNPSSPSKPAPLIEEEPASLPKISPAMRERIERRKNEAGDSAAIDVRHGNQNKEERLLKRVETSNSERVVLARFFAICLCVVAVINLIPAVFHWYQWSTAESQVPIARWIYLQVFVAALHVVYAIYLVQIPDWSALRSVAAAMLAIAAVFGLFSMGLLLGGNEGAIAQFLNLPYVLTRSATIWCVAMLCLSTLMTYMSGKESLNWQRTEQLLREILVRMDDSDLAENEAPETAG